jgi:hypothetical protein
MLYIYVFLSDYIRAAKSEEGFDPVGTAVRVISRQLLC